MSEMIERCLTRALEAPTFADEAGGRDAMTIRDWLEFKAIDAADLGVHLQLVDKDGRPRFHYLDLIRCDEYDDCYRAILRPVVMAVIEAMMEPTFDMMDEGMSHEITAFREDRGQQYSELTNAHVGGSSIKGLWQAMLTAAIAPPNHITESKDE